jgi:hypothetical protein
MRRVSKPGGLHMSAYVRYGGVHAPGEQAWRFAYVSIRQHMEALHTSAYGGVHALAPPEAEP